MTKEEAIKILKPFRACMFDQHGCPISDVAIALDVVIEALEQTRWVSVRERLPEQDKYVFVYLFGDSPYIAWHDGVDWCTDEFVLDEDEEPLEWMPLPIPKPYQEEENDKN